MFIETKTVLFFISHEIDYFETRYLLKFSLLLAKVYKPLFYGFFILDSFVLLESFISLYFTIEYPFYRIFKIIICMSFLTYRNLATKVFKIVCGLFYSAFDFFLQY